VSSRDRRLGLEPFGMGDEQPWWRTWSGVPPSWERQTAAWEQVPSSLWAFFGLSFLTFGALTLLSKRATPGGIGGFVGMAFGNFLRARRREREQR